MFNKLQDLIRNKSLVKMTILIMNMMKSLLNQNLNKIMINYNIKILSFKKKLSKIHPMKINMKMLKLKENQLIKIINLKFKCQVNQSSHWIIK
jgi:hypothetical protein